MVVATDVERLRNLFQEAVNTKFVARVLFHSCKRSMVGIASGWLASQPCSFLRNAVAGGCVCVCVCGKKLVEEGKLGRRGPNAFGIARSEMCSAETCFFGPWVGACRGLVFKTQVQHVHHPSVLQC